MPTGAVPSSDMAMEGANGALPSLEFRILVGCRWVLCLPKNSDKLRWKLGGGTNEVIVCLCASVPKVRLVSGIVCRMLAESKTKTFKAVVVSSTISQPSTASDYVMLANCCPSWACQCRVILMTVNKWCMPLPCDLPDSESSMTTLTRVRLEYVIVRPIVRFQASSQLPVNRRHSGFRHIYKSLPTRRPLSRFLTSYHLHPQLDALSPRTPGPSSNRKSVASRSARYTPRA